MIEEPAVPTVDNITDLLDDKAEFRKIVAAMANGADPFRWVVPVFEFSSSHPEPPPGWDAARINRWAVCAAVFGLTDPSCPDFLVVHLLSAVRENDLDGDWLGILHVCKLALVIGASGQAFVKSLDGALAAENWGAA